MKASARDADARIAKPDPAVKAYLIYGPDRGMTRERADALAANLLDDPDDPFALTQLTEEDVRADPASLHDAMAALSLTGSKRLVRLRLSGETGGAPACELIEDMASGGFAPEACLIVESGDIKPKGKLRKSFEPASCALAIPCYADDARSLTALLETMLDQAGLSLDPDARSAWLPRLEGDRALARSEIDKLITYKMTASGAIPEGNDARILLEDIEAVAADRGEAQLDAIIGPVFDGDCAAADGAYGRALSGGTSPVAVLRALQRRIDQFGSVQCAGGDDGAIARSGAPRFGPQSAQFKQQLRHWTGRRLEFARHLSFSAEREVKRSGAPADALVGELILRLSRGGAQR